VCVSHLSSCLRSKTEKPVFVLYEAILTHYVRPDIEEKTHLGWGILTKKLDCWQRIFDYTACAIITRRLGRITYGASSIGVG
jgi:hypothetical protein